MRIRFHLDEHLPSGVAAGLRRSGIDVTCAAEVGMAGVSDEKQWSFATETGRMLVTQDADFLRLHESRVPHAGIASAAKDRSRSAKCCAGSSWSTT